MGVTGIYPFPKPTVLVFPVSAVSQVSSQLFYKTINVLMGKPLDTSLFQSCLECLALAIFAGPLPLFRTQLFEFK